MNAGFFGFRWRHRLRNQESLPIGGHGKDAENGRRAGFEKQLRRSRNEIRPCADLGAKIRSVAGDVQDFLSVLCPTWIHSPVSGHLALDREGGERRHVDIARSGLRGNVGDVLPVGREAKGRP